MVISRTPFRISFFGGGTDYPVWFHETEGAVLATSIDKYCYITCRYLPPFFTYRSRIAYSKIELISRHHEIKHPAVREVLQFMDIKEGLEIHHDADLPARTGLGSSSSFTVGLLHSLYALRQKMPNKMQLAREAIHVERDLIKENVGSQDQVTAAFGGFNKISFSPTHEIILQPVIMSQSRFHELQDHMLLFFTGFSRHASEIAKSQIQNTCNKKRELRTMYGMVEQALSILTGTGDLLDFGRLLHESWLLKRSLTDKISTPEIDAIYETARKAGANGGKLLGAGGGGFILLFAHPDRHALIRKRLNKLLHVPFRFESGGSQIIFYDCQSFEKEFLAVNHGRRKHGLPSQPPLHLPCP